MKIKLNKTLLKLLIYFNLDNLINIIEYFYELFTASDFPSDVNIDFLGFINLPDIVLGTISLLGGLIGLCLISDDQLRSSAIFGFFCVVSTVSLFLLPILFGEALYILFFK